MPYHWVDDYRDTLDREIKSDDELRVIFAQAARERVDWKRVYQLAFNEACYQRDYYGHYLGWTFIGSLCIITPYVDEWEIAYNALVDVASDYGLGIADDYEDGYPGEMHAVVNLFDDTLDWMNCTKRINPYR